MSQRGTPPVTGALQVFCRRICSVLPEDLLKTISERPQSGPVTPLSSK